MKVVIVRSDDWDGIYIDGKILDQGHELGEGDSYLYLLRLSKNSGFDIDDVDLRWIGDGENYDYQRNILDKDGCYPDLLSDFYPKKKKLYTIDDIELAWDAAVTYINMYLHNGDMNLVSDKKDYLDGLNKN